MSCTYIFSLDFNPYNLLKKITWLLKNHILDKIKGLNIDKYTKTGHNRLQNIIVFQKITANSITNSNYKWGLVTAKN